MRLQSTVIQGAKTAMILGIDPGPKESAFCMWNGERIGTYGKWENGEVLGLIDTLDGGNMELAVEHIQCLGMAVGASVFETAYWIGEFRGAARKMNMPFIPIFRSQVKMGLCNSMRARDSNIRQALIDRFGAPGVKKNPGLTYGISGDVWSAFAVAVTAFDDDKRH